MSDHSDDNESEDEVFMDDLDLSKPRPSNSTLKSTHPLPSSQPAPKWVLHVDVDCFYAQSSYLRIFADMEEEPPIAMRQKHIIVTANYPARALGIRKLMSYEAAKKIDTKLGGGILKFVDASDLTVFREDAFAIETSIRTWTCPVQKKGMDEFDVNISSRRGDPQQLALDLQKHVLDSTSFTVSVGYASSAFLAKLAAGQKKPNGVSTLTQEVAASKVLPKMPMRVIPGLGSSTARLIRRAVLRANNIKEPEDIKREDRTTLTIEHLKKTPVVELRAAIGEDMTRRFLRLADGFDDSEVIDNSADMKKITTVEDSFKSGNVTSIHQLDRECVKIATRLLRTMGAENERAGKRDGANLRVTVREKGIRGRRSKSVPWPKGSVNAEALRRLAMGVVPSLILGGETFNCTLMNLGVEWKKATIKRKGASIGGGGSGSIKKFFIGTMLLLALVSREGVYSFSMSNINVQRLVEERALAREQRDFVTADNIKGRLYDFGVELKDQVGGGATWNFIEETVDHVEIGGMSILGLAHAALGAVEDEGAGEEYVRENVEALGLAILNRVNQLRELNPYPFHPELMGKKAADAAFWLTIAGCENEEVYKKLADVSCEELIRFGTRERCRVVDVKNILEKLAACDLEGHEIFKVGKGILTAKGEEELRDLTFESPRSLILLFRQARRTRKVKATREHGRMAWENLEAVSGRENGSGGEGGWKDGKSGLIVDVGCGMGVSMLGLDKDERFEGYNKLGIDLSRRGVRFGRALSKRRGRSGVVRFWETEAEDGVERLKSYEGEVKAIMIQFPTPYMLGSGNKQLPGEDDGFMVTAGLARKVAEAGARYVVIQSNVEDTALRCSQLFVEAGYVKVPRGEEDELFWGGDDEALKEIAAKEERVTERTQRWLEGGGEELMGRAGIDKGWRQTEERFFGCQGVTETEVNCVISGTPVHRMILKLLL